MSQRHDTDPRPTTEVDPAVLRELLARQRRLATGSDELAPEPRPTVQMHRDELLGLRDQCAPVVEVPAEPFSQAITVVEKLPAIAPEPRVRRIVIGTAIACLATLWLAATGWLLATW